MAEYGTCGHKWVDLDLDTHVCARPPDHSRDMHECVCLVVQFIDGVTLLWHWPDVLADWCDRQVLAAHQPVMVPADDLAEWPNGEMPWCVRCDSSWPCGKIK